MKIFIIQKVTTSYLLFATYEPFEKSAYKAKIDPDCENK